jgi:predicted signal transduction protein with EAL and GGDEF domain
MDDDASRAPLFAERLLSSFAAPFDLEGIAEHVSCSVGIALAPQHGNDVNTLMRNADLALYAAKAAGRSTYKVYERSMRLAAQRRHDLTLELRRALGDGEFALDYQPIMSLVDDSIVGFEALIRWRHPQRGLISPTEFIPLAEETGLVIAIGDWVIREACRVAAGWPATMKVAVNLSVCQFRQVGLLATVVSALAETGLPPDRLELEITESVFLSENKQNIHLLHALKELGVRIAIDDFGTGYSSLSYLRFIPFDKIKVDHTFVADIDTDPGSVAILRAVIGLGSSFGATTTAEGVETQEQLHRLQAEGINQVQGYLIGRPMPAREIPQFMARRRGANPASLERKAG